MGERLFYPGSLHCHTQYSNLRLRDAINKEDELINYALELGNEVVAITDHETISSWIKVEKYYNKIKEMNPNFKVIRGNEIYLCRNGLNASNFNKEVDRYYHFILLAKDRIGAQQIMEISTRAWKRSYMARGMRRVPTYYQDLVDIIKPNPGHVIGSTACLGGALPTQILRGTSQDKLNRWIDQMCSIFGKNDFYLEMQPSKNHEQIFVNRKLKELADEHGLKYIITTDAHYLKKEDRQIHKAYLNAQNGEREVDEFYATTYMMDSDELESYMKLSFDDIETIYAAYSSIKEIKDKCEDFSLLKPLKIPQLPWKEQNVLMGYKERLYLYEKIPYLKTFATSKHESDQILVEAVLKGIENHPDLQNKEAYDEINACLEDTWVSSNINKASWASYFLNLQKIIEECWEAGSLVGCGRGSGVGFILLYCLDVIQINPLRETTKTKRWRFLNPNRVSVLDIDVDIEGGRRKSILDHLRNVYGDDRMANVATFGTEGSRSAIQTACRGLGVDVDIAQYLSSMIKADRGMTRTLAQTFYGDEENGILPDRQFVYEMTENYPEVWRVAQKIEGLVCRMGIHAGGVIFVDEPFTNSTGLMRAPDNTLVTQFDLHDCEDVSLIKYDLLSVEALDKMHVCIDLLCEHGYVKPKPTLKETYESTIGIYTLERDDPNMWKMIWDHKITSLFQMEKQSGIQAIALVHPTSVDDLATMNSVIRLMAQEKGAEQPLNKFARFKNNINLWYDEMRQYGLTEEEMKLLEPIVKISYGICESQEGFMELVQIPECGGFDLTWADKLRKSIAKKNPAAYEELKKQYFLTIKEKGLSPALCNYVWNVLVATSKGYGFNKSHTLAYSLIALQEMNLAFKYPIIFWNCANLITDSGGVEDSAAEEENAYVEDITYDSDFENFAENDDDEDDEEESKSSTKKAKKTRTTDYGKIATAIGKMKSENVEVTLPDINRSSFTFSPDAEHNRIIYGLSGITRISEDVIKEIISHRPYTSLKDFMSKVKLNALQMVNLIKSGAFDEFADRRAIMDEYLRSIADLKKVLNLRNMQMLISYGLLPDELSFETKVFNFNKYLKKFKDDKYYYLDSISSRFYNENFDPDKLELSDDFEFKIRQTTWDGIYQKKMDKCRNYIKAHHDELLELLNNKLLKEVEDKYAKGTLSKWEMDSVSFYYHEHELSKLHNEYFNISNYFLMGEEPEIDRVIPIKGKMVPLFKIQRIAGTILDKNKNRKMLTLLTTNGVVTVSIFGDVFTHYDRQISVKDANGKKKVIEKSWLSRGNKVIISGVRQGDKFNAKKYSRTPWHLVELITDIDENGKIKVIGERAGDSE